LFERSIESPFLYYQPDWVHKQEQNLKDEMGHSWRLMSEVLAKREEIQDKIE
jgi:hypothetical protein